MTEKEELLLRLGRRIADLRRNAGMSQKDLAHRCGKDQESIARVERGKRNVSIYYLHEVARALNISVNELIDF